MYGLSNKTLRENEGVEVTDLSTLEEILNNQKEVKYLTYMAHITQDGTSHLEMSTVGYNKKLRYKSVDLCLTELIDILYDMKAKETYLLNKEKKEKK